MPETAGDTQAGSAAAPQANEDSPFWDAFEDLLTVGSAVELDPEDRPASARDEEPRQPGSGSTATAATTTGGPADSTSALEPAGGDDERGTTVADAGADAGAASADSPAPAAEDDPAAGDDPAPPTRAQRGALLTQREQERDEARQRAEAAERRAAELERELQTRPAPVDLGAVQAEVAEFLGLAAPVDEQGRPTGEEPVFTRLQRESTSERGIEFEDEQKLYAELTRRHAMAGKVLQVARGITWGEVAGELLDPELGLDRAAVDAAGSIAGWKRTYRQAVERGVEQRVAAAVDSVKSDYEARLAELSRQLESATRRAEEQAATTTARLERARGVRTPVGASLARPAGGARTGFGGSAAAQPGGDLTSELADAFREMAEAGR